MTADRKNPLEQELDELAAELGGARGEEPSDALDARVLAAARAAVPESAGRPVAEAWRTPFAAAASVLLCSVLYLSLPGTEQDFVPETAGRQDRAAETGSARSAPAAPLVRVADGEAAKPAPPADPAESSLPAREAVTATAAKPDGSGRGAAPAAPEAMTPSESAAPEAAGGGIVPVSARFADQPESGAFAQALAELLAGSGDDAGQAPDAQSVGAGATAILPQVCVAGAGAAQRLWLLRDRARPEDAGICVDGLPEPQRSRVQAAWTARVADGAVDRLLQQHGLQDRYTPAGPPAN